MFFTPTHMLCGKVVVEIAALNAHNCAQCFHAHNEARCYGADKSTRDHSEEARVKSEDTAFSLRPF